MALENRETAEDIAVTDRLLSERNRVVLSQSVKEAMKESAAKASMNGSVVGDEDEDAAISVVGDDVIKGKGKAKKGAATATAASSHAKGKGKRVATAPTASSKEKKVTLTIEKPKARQPAMLIPDLDEDDKIDAFVKRGFHADSFFILCTNG
jgi:Ino eighty subunit 1